jgi:hypothetical protein
MCKYKEWGKQHLLKKYWSGQRENSPIKVTAYDHSVAMSIAVFQQTVCN